jgi:hypothetical protein
MTRPCKLPLWTASLVLLASCVANTPAPPRPLAPPQPLAPPKVSAADIRNAEQRSYWSGYAAGRRYEQQQQQNAQPTPEIPGPAPLALPDVVVATPAATAPAPVPAQPIPPPPDSYSAKGPARPVATPVN